jgi:hypothetical protein
VNASALHPQQSTKPPGEDVLAVARALALLHARLHHDAEIANRRERHDGFQKTD